ncbi:hypothetical protein JCM11491_002046 [Sporobolomyces phaffii]
MSEELAVVLLNAEGDKFNAAYLTEGGKGGRTAAEHVSALVKQRINSGNRGTKVVVYLVSHGLDNTIGSGQTKAFLRGFASTAEACFVVEPLTLDGVTSASARVLQLLQLYVPLKAVANIFVGSLHNTYLYSYLRNLAPHYQYKLTLVSTITVAPPYRVLVDSGTVEAWRGLEPVFGGFAIPDMSALRIEDEPPVKDEPVASRIDEVESEPDQEQGQEQYDHAPESPPAEYFQQFLWSSSESESEANDDGDDEWEVAGPRSNKKPTSSFGRDTSSTQLETSGSSGSSPVGVRFNRSTRQLSSTSGASRRRKQRERVSRENLGQDRKRAENSPPLEGRVSSLPAWQPPRLTFTEPHPCINHYLCESGCQDRHCVYSHDYEFASEEEEHTLYRLFIKSMICTQYLRGKCKKGESCIKGHRCPFTLKGCRYREKCYYLTQGLPHSSPVSREY